jgi:hypothetical protein
MSRKVLLDIGAVTLASLFKAGDRIRTDDILLGKQAFYH